MFSCVLGAEINIDGTVAGVLDEPYSQLTPLSGVAVQARESTQAATVSILQYVAWRAGKAIQLCGLC